MDPISMKQRLYDAGVDLSDIKNPDKICEKVLSQACNLLNVQDGFLRLFNPALQTEIPLTYNLGIYMSDKHDLSHFALGVPLFAPAEQIAFLGVGSTHNAIADNKKIMLLSRYAVIASWALCHAFYNVRGLAAEQNSYSRMVHNRHFYKNQIILCKEDKGYVEKILQMEKQFEEHSMDDDQLQTMLHKPQNLAWIPLLEKDEKEMLRLIEKGCSNLEISAVMHFSASTVKYYLSRIYLKLNAKNRAQAIAVARQKGVM